MKGYGPTGVSYSYSRGNLIDDLVNGILVCEDDFPNEVSQIQVPPWLVEEVADSLIKRGVAKGYTWEFVSKREGDSSPRLYVVAPRKEEA
jgi:hypothetical protein